MPKQTRRNQPEQDHAFAHEVTAMIDRIKQGLQVCGNDIDLVGIDQNRVVTVRVRTQTEDQDQVHDVLETGITEMIRQRIPQAKEIVAV